MNETAFSPPRHGTAHDQDGSLGQPSREADPSSKKAKRQRVQRGDLISALDARFGGMTDAQIVQDLNYSGTLKGWADTNLLPLFPKRNNPIGASEPDYHGAITYYLHTWRPDILKSFDKKASVLAKAWPINHSEIRNELRTGGWWARTLRRRINDSIRQIMKGQTIPDWIERIWPTIVELLEKGVYKGNPPYLIVEDLRKRLCLPRTIKINGKNHYFEFQQLLRKKIAAYIRKAGKTPKLGAQQASPRKAAPPPVEKAKKAVTKPSKPKTKAKPKASRKGSGAS
jgi:hypothetical protein